MSGDTEPVHDFFWVDDSQPILGGQWLIVDTRGREPHPVVLAEVVAAGRAGSGAGEPLRMHVDATLRVVEAAGELEDELFPDAESRLRSALHAADTALPEVDRDTIDGELVRRGAEALEKLAADLAELVEEQLDGGSLSTLPPDSTRALCQAAQTAWRLRRLVDPPSPLYL